MTTAPRAAESFVSDDNEQDGDGGETIELMVASVGGKDRVDMEEEEEEEEEEWICDCS